jgi:hypothetical protein
LERLATLHAEFSSARIRIARARADHSRKGGIGFSPRAIPGLRNGVSRHLLSFIQSVILQFRVGHHLAGIPWLWRPWPPHDVEAMKME